MFGSADVWKEVYSKAEVKALAVRVRSHITVKMEAMTW